MLAVLSGCLNIDLIGLYLKGVVSQQYERKSISFRYFFGNYFIYRSERKYSGQNEASTQEERVREINADDIDASENETLGINDNDKQ